jgi:hypothetical protein
MDWIQFKDALLQFLAVGCVGYLLTEVRKVRESLESLNLKMVVVIRDIENLNKTDNNHENRISRIEMNL